jgi:hypothetical protein
MALSSFSGGPMATGVIARPLPWLETKMVGQRRDSESLRRKTQDRFANFSRGAIAEV